MNACAMVNLCLARQQGEQADLGASRGDEHYERGPAFIPPTDTGVEGAYRNLDTETISWSG